MAWKSNASTSTKHTCGGPVFGRKAPLGECPRCDELHAGKDSIAWVSSNRRACEIVTLAAIKAHDCVVRRCGPVCTAFE